MLVPHVHSITPYKIHTLCNSGYFRNVKTKAKQDEKSIFTHIDKNHKDKL